MGCLGWLVTTFLAIGASGLALCWPLALASHHGHIAAWGWLAETGWLLGALVVLGVVHALRHAPDAPAVTSGPQAPRNERMAVSDRR
jgi:hypothetical protein